MRAILIALAAFAGFAAPAVGQETLTDAQKAEIGEVIRDYLLENPEVIEDAIIELQRRNREAEAAASREAIAASEAELFSHPLDFAVGPEDAPIQIVEFFDYNCSFCRRAAPWVKNLLAERGDQVRFVFKESPIFAYDKAGSDVGARAALAAKDEGKYLDLHFALLGAEGVVMPEDVERAAKEIGLDWRALQKRMAQPEIAQHLVDSLDLGYRIGMTGTPTFIINGEIVIGADTFLLDQKIEAALATRAAANAEDPDEPEEASELR